MKTNKSNGVTLIVLVITIIVLLILASISIATLMGKNGSVNKAISAKEAEEKAEEREMIVLAATKAIGEDVFGDLKYEKLKNELDKIIKKDAGREYKITPEHNATEYTVTYLDTNRSYTVDDDGNVKE
ncbi:MAG: hypothetical protein HFJ55_03320 [Clostridia bacterium]|jgi:hypothetical protein|nr:hypothetical protein [Clostridia bacterium]